MHSIIASFFAVIILASGCKTCPANEEITETLLETLGGQAQCADSAAMRADVATVVESFGFCSEEFDSQRLMQSLPDGAWSSRSGVCFAAAQRIKVQLAGHYPASWKCLKTEFPDKAILVACSELE